MGNSRVTAHAQHAADQDRAANHSVPPLRVGVLLDADTQPRWIEYALRLIGESSIAQIAVVIAPARQQRTNVIGAGPDRSSFLFRWFVETDRRMFRRQPDPLAMTTIAPLVTDALSIRLPDVRLLAEDTRSHIREARLDVILCLGPPEIGRQLVAGAQHGVWYFPDLVHDAGIERPIGFEAMVNGVSVVETSLNHLTASGTRGQVLYRAVSAVNRYSPHYTERRLLWKMATFPLRALVELSPTTSMIAQRTKHDVPRLTSASPRPAVPGNVRTLRVVARLGLRLLRHAARSALFRSVWAVAFRRDPVFSLETLTRPNPAGAYTFIKSPPDRFWADPFPVCDGDAQWLFVEEFPHRAERAHLAVMELDQDGRVGPSVPVLARPYHLSYPYVFRWEGDWYMVPETLDNRAVDLYRSTRFPFEWVHVQRLLDDVSAVDATLVEIDNQWWMFTTIAPFGGSENDELHIYQADSPLGPWVPHPGNPQTSDVRRSRPAGRIFTLDGSWYRPAQDCSRRYGYAITINRITTLSGTQYAEEVVARVKPTWARSLLGTHTFNHANGLTLVDGARWRPRFSIRSQG